MKLKEKLTYFLFGRKRKGNKQYPSGQISAEKGPKIS